jgi:hypothetical protein
MPVLRTGNVRKTKVQVLGFPDLSNIDPKLEGVFLDASGNIFHINNGYIYFTSSIIRPGTSGSPLVDWNGDVLGMVTNRFLENDVFTGIGNGLSITKIIEAISNRDVSTNNTPILFNSTSAN